MLYGFRAAAFWANFGPRSLRTEVELSNPQHCACPSAEAPLQPRYVAGITSACCGQDQQVGQAAMVAEKGPL